MSLVRHAPGNAHQPLRPSPPRAMDPAPTGPEVVACPQAGPRVAIVVAGRNAAPWLAECLDSCLAQSVPCEVIYSDDASSDESLDIAAGRLDRGLQLVASPRQAGPCEARNRGAAATRAPLLCFVDADDVLPPDFLARHLQAWSPGVPFVYGPAQAFGDGPCAGILWPVPAWRDWDRWQTNTVNTSALYSRQAWEAAGRWDGTARTMWDWELALRAAKTTDIPPQPSTATLRYRQHAASWSTSIGEKDRTASRFSRLEEIRRRNASLTVCTVFSGRLPGLLTEWVDRVAAAIDFAQLARPATFVGLLHNGAWGLHRPLADDLARRSHTFASWRIDRLDAPLAWSREHDRRDQVAAFMARSCQTLRDRAAGDLLWFVEDDILIERPTFLRLWEAVTAGNVPPHAVGAPYRNRHVPIRYVGGWREADGWREFDALPADGEPFDVDFTGTGCLLTWADRPRIPRVWRSHEQGVAAHDWAYCMDIKRAGGTVRILPTARVGHVASESRTLWPETAAGGSCLRQPEGDR